jgi:hypothetical protein
MNRSLCIALSAILSFAKLGASQDFSLDLGPTIQLSVGGELSGGGQPLTFMQVAPGLPTEPQALVGVQQVIEDLQLVESQRDEIQERTQLTHEKFQRRHEELRKKFGKKAEESPEEFQQAVNKLNEALKKELEEIVDSILLPFQRSRLQQISAQAKLRASGSDALSSVEFAEALKLTDEQKKKLADSAGEFRKELMEEIRELRQKRQREEIEKVLTKNQRKKLDELLGDELTKAKPKPDNK